MQTDRRDITEILLKVALNTIALTIELVPKSSLFFINFLDAIKKF
jgi:hypothetical protein